VIFETFKAPFPVNLHYEKRSALESSMHFRLSNKKALTPTGFGRR
jgi:hypothetical protein